MVARFRSSQEGSLQEQLLSLRQTTTVKEFRRHFEVLSAPLKGLPDAVLEAAFVNGLRADIQAELRQVNPTGLAAKMILAQRIEDKLVALESYRFLSSQRWSKSQPSGAHFSTRTTTPHLSKPETTTPTQPNQNSQNLNLQNTNSQTSCNISNTTFPYKKMTDKEMEELRAKGLCYRCNEKFFRGHRCSQKKLQVLLLMDDDIDEDVCEENRREVEESELVAGPDSAVLCLSALMGLCPPNSLKVKGKLKNKEVVVLIDSGATHNFISDELAKNLGL